MNAPAKHTPGPWKVDSSERFYGPGTVIRYNGLLVARMESMASQADAELIASAPALLAERDALREQVKTLREGAQAACQFLIRTNLCPSDTLSALAELRAALASTEAEVKP